MSFIWPTLLWSLSAIPLLIFLYVRMQQRRTRFAERYGSLGLVQQAGGRAVGSRRHLPAILFLAGLIVLLAALARPQMVVGLPKAEGIVILAFDVSGSMAADDFKPSRMEAAKAVAKEFVARQPSSVQVGVVAFSESGFSVQLPTNDQSAILASIERLHPQRGTSLAAGIVMSLNTIANVTGQAPILGSNQAGGPQNATPTPAPAGTDKSAVIILLTDGENNMEPDPLAAAQLAADHGVRIHTIGIGSPAGTNLTVNGFTVHTQLDEAALQQIAKLSDGLYFNAQTEDDLRDVYESIEPRLQVEREKTEVTALFAGLSIVILLIGGLISLLWFSHVP